MVILIATSPTKPIIRTATCLAEVLARFQAASEMFVRETCHPTIRRSTKRNHSSCTEAHFTLPLFKKNNSRLVSSVQLAEPPGRWSQGLTVTIMQSRIINLWFASIEGTHYICMYCQYEEYSILSLCQVSA